MARHGYDKTTIAAITQAADVGFGTFYLYFESKRDILRALVEDAVNEHVARMQAIATRSEPPEEAIRQLVASNVDSVIANRDLFRIIYRQDGGRERPLSAVHEMFLHALEDAIARGIHSGAFRNMNPALGARAIAGMVPSVLLWAARSRSASRDQLVDAIVGLALRGIMYEEG